MWCTKKIVCFSIEEKTSKLASKNVGATPEINISPVPDIVSGSRHFVPVTCNLCRSTVYDILLKSKNLPVIVTDRKRILSVTHEIVPGIEEAGST